MALTSSSKGLLQRRIVELAVCIQCVPRPPPTDLQWGPQDALSAAVLADGTVRLFDCRPRSPVSLFCSEPMGSVLMSLDWRSDTIVASGIDGQLFQWVVREGGGLHLGSSWAAHELEAWMVRLHPTSVGEAWSGSDDGSLKRWDLRSGPQETFCSRRHHEAGVVAIEFHPTDQHYMLTGSYDEQLRRWDLRQLSRPVWTSPKFGDGVWRLKWHPRHQGLLLVAGMRSGAHLVDVGSNEGADTFNLVGHYAKHADMPPKVGDATQLVYGADWCHDPDIADGNMAATVSFYDCSMHVWAADNTCLT